jgi:hypothetical protein
MECQVQNLPVFAPLSHRSVQRVSGEDLRNQVRGVRSLIVRHPHTPNINRAELASVVLEEFLESGIRQLDAALPVKNDDP